MIFNAVKKHKQWNLVYFKVNLNVNGIIINVRIIIKILCNVIQLNMHQEMFVIKLMINSVFLIKLI